MTAQILLFPTSPEKRKPILHNILDGLKRDMEILRSNLLWNMASQKLFATYQDRIADVERELNAN